MAGLVIHKSKQKKSETQATSSNQVAAATPAPTVQPVVAVATQTNSEQEEPDENEKYKQSDNVKMLGHMLGMKSEQAGLVFEWLDFIVLAGALGWVLTHSLPKVFYSRAQNIQKQIADARTATEQANIRLAEVEVKLSRLDGEIAALHANAQRDAADEQLRMAAAMEAEKQRILTASEQEIATATALAQRQLKQFAAGLAIDQAAQKLVISADTERLMIEQFAAGLSDDQGRGGLN